MTKYIHYGSDNFDINKFDPIKNGEAAYLRVIEKPEGGLWASPIDSKNNWHDWCLNNDFKVDRLEKSFTFTLKLGTKVLTIKTIQDITDIFDMLTVVPLGKRIGNHINYEELLKLGYDAIMVYISNVDVYYRLYGWDVDSLLVMNPNCIEVLEGVDMFDYSNIVNLTPHAIDVLEKHDDNTYATIVSIPPSGTIARLDQTTVHIGKIGDIPITATEFGEITGLPPYDGYKKYIVSYPIARRLKRDAFIRNDILITNESVRDSEGQIIGCLSLAVYR